MVAEEAEADGMAVRKGNKSASNLVDALYGHATVTKFGPVFGLNKNDTFLERYKQS